MPSGKAQEQLIRSTYALAGLDPSIPEDRPQYFEAHGSKCIPLASHCHMSFTTRVLHMSTDIFP